MRVVNVLESMVSGEVDDFDGGRPATNSNKALEPSLEAVGNKSGYQRPAGGESGCRLEAGGIGDVVDLRARCYPKTS